VQAARVVGVEMGDDDAADVGGQDPEVLELRGDLLLGLHLLANGEPEERLPAREVARLGDAGRLAGVDDDHALGVLDGEGEDRKRLRPLAVEERVYEPTSAMAHAFPPPCSNGDGPGLDCVDLHLVSCLLLEDFVFGAKPRRISSTTPSASCSSIGPPVTSSR
jgi:hypothetical protein